MNKVSLNLQPSEAVVARAAAAIYAAHIAAGHVKKGEENTYIGDAVKDAIAIAKLADESIQSDDEMS